MPNDDDGILEDWYPGYFLDPRNAWKWMPAAFPGWLATVREKEHGFRPRFYSIAVDCSAVSRSRDLHQRST